MKTKLDDKTKKIIENVAYPLLSLLLVMGIWWIVAAVKDKPLVLPAPDKVIVEFFKLFASAPHSDMLCIVLCPCLRHGCAFRTLDTLT